MTNRMVNRGKWSENKLAEALTSATGETWFRTPGSGSGHAWKIFAKRKVRGDVYCTSADFPVFFENKKVGKNRIAWDRFLAGEIPPLVHRWWLKACTDAMIEGKHPALVLSRDQGPFLVLMKAAAFQQLFEIVQFTALIQGGYIFTSVNLIGQAYLATKSTTTQGEAS